MRKFESVGGSEGVDPEVQVLRDQLRKLEADFTRYRRKVESEKADWLRVASEERMLKFLEGMH